MSAPRSDRRSAARSQRPKATTVFAAAFLAGAAAAVGLNRTLDVHLAQRQPRVESEPIFVALRSLPQGAPLTVWDVALRDWPKAMLPAAALRPRDSFAGMVLKHPIREGQPILSVQLVKVSTQVDSQVADTTAAPAPSAGSAPVEQTDLWAPAEVPAPEIRPSEDVPQTAAVDPSEPVVEAGVEAPVETLAEVVTSDTVSVDTAADEGSIPEPVVAEPVVIAATVATDIDVAPAPVANDADTSVPPARETVMRYLVVPERIALEADRSFVPPAEPHQRRETADSVAQTPATQSASPSAQSQVQEGRADRTTTRTSANRDRQPQRSSRSAAEPAKQEKSSFLRSMMPSLSLGMGAVEPAQKTAAAPESKSPQASRPTFRGLGLFR